MYKGYVCANIFNVRTNPALLIGSPVRTHSRTCSYKLSPPHVIGTCGIYVLHIYVGNVRMN
jgi:hypothetical protein